MHCRALHSLHTYNKTKFPPEVCRAKSDAALRTYVHIACPRNLCFPLLASGCYHTYLSISPCLQSYERNKFSEKSIFRHLHQWVKVTKILGDSQTNDVTAAHSERDQLISTIFFFLKLILWKNAVTPI